MVVGGTAGARSTPSATSWFPVVVDGTRVWRKAGPSSGDMKQGQYLCRRPSACEARRPVTLSRNNEWGCTRPGVSGVPGSGPAAPSHAQWQHLALRW